jgi:hypothetical protein
MSLAAVLLVIYGLKRIAEAGLDSVPAVSILIGLALGIQFLRRQRTLADPLIDLRLLRVPAFSASLATYMLGCFVAWRTTRFRSPPTRGPISSPRRPRPGTWRGRARA